MSKIGTIVIDDESNGRDILTALLEKFCPSLEMMGTADTAASGIRLIIERKPQLVFLDINMPGQTGFEMLQQFDAIDFEVIFVTAHDNYALKAFKFSAIDYILKPIDLEDLKTAVKKAEEKLAFKVKPKERYNEFFNNIKNIQNPFDKLGLATRDGLIFIKISDIIRCESDVNYTWFYLEKGEKILASKTLKDFEEMLDEYNFYRVHKSHLVNLAHLKRYIKGEGGSVIMSDNSEVEVSRRNKEGLMKRLQQIG
jgi:two-component system, LytTR family, response regulator